MGIRILMVEDDALIASSVIRGLREEGFTVEHADDGESAWAALQSGPWDLVLSCAPADDLPVHDGVARFAHAGGTPSLSAHLDGADAILGPAVVPGRTACFQCARRRRIANGARPALLHALADALLERRVADRESTYLAPAAGALGHATAIAVMDLLERGEAAPLAGTIAVRSLADLATSLHAVRPAARRRVGSSFVGVEREIFCAIPRPTPSHPDESKRRCRPTWSYAGAHQA